MTSTSFRMYRAGSFFIWAALMGFGSYFGLPELETLVIGFAIQARFGRHGSLPVWGTVV